MLSIYNDNPNDGNYEFFNVGWNPWSHTIVTRIYQPTLGGAEHKPDSNNAHIRGCYQAIHKRPTLILILILFIIIPIFIYLFIYFSKISSLF
jgi:hypothetical protein